MQIWTMSELRGLALGALSLASVTACTANVGEENEETTATAGERVIYSGTGAWNAGDPDLILVRSDRNMCFLTNVQGKFRTANDRVEIKDVGGNWVLTGGAPSSSTKYGAGARCIAWSNPNPNKKVWKWPDPEAPPGDFRPNELHSWTTSACFLTGLSGTFNAVTDVVRTRRSDDGKKWVLDGSTYSKNITAYAACVDNVLFTDNRIAIASQGQDYMLPNTQDTIVGPVSCFLTQVGGFLAWSGFPFDSFPDMYVAHRQSGTKWNWWIVVGSQGLGVNAGTRCIF